MEVVDEQLKEAHHHLQGIRARFQRLSDRIYPNPLKCGLTSPYSTMGGAMGKTEQSARIIWGIECIVRCLVPTQRALSITVSDAINRSNTQVEHHFDFTRLIYITADML